MKRRIAKVFAASATVVFIAGFWIGVASAVECVSQDLSVSCYRTIQAAVDAADPYELIDVFPGEYVENVTVAKAGVQVVGRGGWPGEVVISAYDVGVVVSLIAPQAMVKNVSVQVGTTGIVVTGAGATIDDVIVSRCDNGISVSADRARVINSSIRGIGSPGTGVGIVATGADFSVLSSIVHTIGGTCVHVIGDGALISKNRIIDCGEYGVKIQGSGAEVLENNLLVAQHNLINIDGTGPGSRISKNTIQGGAGAGIRAVSDAPNIFKNSISDCDAGIVVRCDSCGGAKIGSNVVSGIFNSSGIDVRAASVGMVVQDNISRDNSGEGFRLTGTGLEAFRNTAIANGRDGILVRSSDMKIWDNQSKTNAGNGIGIEGGVTGTRLWKNNASSNFGFDFFDAGTGTMLGHGNRFGTIGGP